MINLTSFYFALVLQMTFPNGMVISNLSLLKTSDGDMNLAEINVIYRSGEHLSEITQLGNATVLIPRNFNGVRLKMEYNRFITRDSAPFAIGDSTYIPISLLYDNETNDPRDDLFIMTVPIFVSNDSLMLAHMEEMGTTMQALALEDAPLGRSTQTVGTVRLTNPSPDKQRKPY